MSDIDVTVETEPSPEPSSDPVVENSQSFTLGEVCAKVEMLEGAVAELQSKCDMHDDLINLHDHSGLATTGDLQDSEERIISVVTSEPEPEPELEPVTEPEPEPEPSESDEPPKSQKQKKSIADRYYGN